MPSPLQIIAVEKSDKRSCQGASPPRSTKRHEIEARCDAAWRHHPEKFDVRANAFERDRIAKTKELLSSFVISGMRGVDLGCGAGELTRFLAEKGCVVDAIDASSIPLETLAKENNSRIHPLHDILPYTRLDDGVYDLVLCCEVIGEIYPQLHRLFLSELARLVSVNGHVIITSAVDPRTQNPSGQLRKLIETEFFISEQHTSHHRLALALSMFFSLPTLYSRCGRIPSLREQEYKQRKGFARLRFRFQTNFLFSKLWRLLSFATEPLAQLLQQNRWIGRKLEALSKFLLKEHGITHVAFVVQRRKMNPSSSPL